MNPSSAAPSRRSVTALAAWSAPVVALAVATPAAAASASPASEQDGWNVAARAGRGLSSGGLVDYTGFAFQETANRTPAASVAFVETCTVDITVVWGQYLDSAPAKAEAAALAGSLLSAVLVAPATSAGVVVGAWSAVDGPRTTTPERLITSGGVNDGGNWYLGQRWSATRTVSVQGLAASGQAGHSDVAIFQRPFGSPDTAFAFALSPVAGSGAISGDDAPVLQGTVTVAASPYTTPTQGPGGIQPGGPGSVIPTTAPTSTSTPTPAPTSAPPSPSTPRPLPSVLP